ncbi:MAG: HEAT repeat domain-containing protein [Planctomycetes bacterium]|nr:HEAT repeat domain-containing protein [Planctomycetota bacterium]
MRFPFSRRRTSALALTICLALVATLWPARADRPPKKPEPPRSPLTPEQARAAFRVAPGLRVELVAAEPHIESPVAIAFDEDGRLWVVEMRDYPNGPGRGKKPEGRIKILEDKDGDGFYETSHVFADGLLFANGLMPWRGGVIVTAAPHISYLKDTDGDGKADKREVLYEGFAAENPQLRVSHPVLGLDGWVYVANGLRGGQVRAHGKPDKKPISLAGMDFRFLPDGGDDHEAISGMGQYGNCFDDWGRRFVCDNRHHLRHVVLENRYLKRNPFLVVGEPVQDISVLEDGPLSSGGKIYPISRNWTTSNLHAGRFTAACGVHVYGGNLLPDKYRGAAFTCDPTGNLVHCEILTPHGATFQSKPDRAGIEFLASPDDWFRPVSMAEGPDGALYVVDMYRAVIEHPDFMPPELQKRPDLTLGKERGRIWRIVPEGHKHKPVRPKLSKASTAELVSLLSHRNAWWRVTAHRLLRERQDREAIIPLKKLAFASNKSLAQVHAAWLLKNFDAADESRLIWLLMAEKHPRVREHVVRLLEIEFAPDPVMLEHVLRLASDPDAQVRFQVALSLGQWDDDRILDPLANIALRGANDRWTRLAVASSVPKRAGALVARLLETKLGLTKERSAGRLALLRELAALVGARRDAKEVAGLLLVVTSLSEKDAAAWQLAAVEGLAEGMSRRGTQLGAFLKSLPKEARPAEESTNALLTRFAAAASNLKRDPVERVSAVRLMAHLPWEKAGPILTHLLTRDPAQEVRLAAVRALAAHNRDEVLNLLLKSWKSYTPTLRREVTEALLRQPAWALALLKEVEASRVNPGDIDALRAKQLIAHPSGEVRTLARRLLQDSLPAERKQVLARYQPALKRKGDAQKGREVFKKNCATCHHVAGIGIDVGPDISDTRTKTAEMLLGDILNPNQAIDSNYVNYLVTTKSGKSLTGIIAAETVASITLKRAENQTDVVLRQDIDEITSTGASLMPEGLEKMISIEEMADLLSFLKNWRYLDGAGPSLDGKP